MSITRRPAPAAIDGGPDRSADARRARGWRRVARGALVIAAGTAALALAGPMALRPFVDAAGAAGEVTVAFVLDFGPSGSQVVGCVSVPATDSRYDALSAFATEKGLVPPSYAPSGLLCSIDLIPASGCGQSVGGGYIYWSYFTGSGGRWIYSSTGAFATVTKGDVEGWRFQDPGTGRPNDPGPRTAAVFRSICSSGSPPTTTTTTTTTSTTTPPGTGSGSSGAGPQASAPVQTPAARVAHMPAATGGRTAATAPRHGAATTTTTTVSTGSAVTSTTSLNFTAPTGLPADLATARGAGADPGTGSAPLIIGGLVILALAIAAWVRWRARPRTP
jgi:hypothetical protein